MEKKIEDYLHLYIGVKLERGGIVTHKLLAAADEAAFDAYLDFKPILRPLASMTEAETKEYKDLFLEHPDCYEKTRWLLSKGFDLFNLIPEGLALDSTPQPITPVNN